MSDFDLDDVLDENVLSGGFQMKRLNVKQGDACVSHFRSVIFKKKLHCHWDTCAPAKMFVGPCAKVNHRWNSNQGSD